MTQLTFFDHSSYLDQLSNHRDPLEKLNSLIKWSIFTPELERILKKERKSNAGRPPYDVTMMLKVLIIQSLYGLSDEQAEFQILDRYTFKRFLGIHSESEIPDAKTIWLFRDRLGEKGVERLFKKFSYEMNKRGFAAKKGSIVDASFVDAPKQRNSREENEMIKNGETPKDWNKAKRAQKDVDARWTKKNNETHYGYKVHACVDNKYKLIRFYKVTSANVHDSQVFTEIIPTFRANKCRKVYADSAYRSDHIETSLTSNGLKSNIHEKGNRGGKLTEDQMKLNHLKSTTRVRVEHVFARLKQLKADSIRCIGVKRAAVAIGISNLVYNMDRIASMGGLRPKAA